MSFDLTNKNIQDTFQNLLQRTGSDNHLYDLLGNEIGDLRISGSLTAQQYIVSSSVTNISIATLSGSTTFGDSLDDTHTFIGNITSSGTISASGGIFSGAHYFNVSQNDDFIFYHPPSDAIAIQSQDININASNGVGIGYGVTQNNSAKLDVNGNINTNLHITASGNISSSGDIFANSGSFNYITASKIDVDASTIRIGGEELSKANLQTLRQGKTLKSVGAGKINPDMLADNGVFTGNITASGNISGSSTSTIEVGGDILNTQVVQMTSPSASINTFNTGSHQTCKYLLQVISASFIQSSEMLVMQNDSNAFHTEYAQMNSGLNLVNFSSKISGENVELIASSSFISCSVKFVRTLI